MSDPSTYYDVQPRQQCGSCACKLVVAEPLIERSRGEKCGQCKRRIWHHGVGDVVYQGVWPEDADYRPMTGEEFRQWRRRHNMTQENAAQVLRISHRTVTNYESGAYPIPHPVYLATRAIDQDEI